VRRCKRIVQEEKKLIKHVLELIIMGLERPSDVLLELIDHLLKAVIVNHCAL